MLFAGDIGKLILPFITIITCYIYMFLSNYTGQEVIDHNNHVFNTAWDIVI